MRLAVGNSHVRELTDKSESNRAQNRFLETCADDGVAVRPHQHRRAIFQCLRKRFSPFHGADETRLGIDRGPLGGRNLAYMWTGRRPPFNMLKSELHFEWVWQTAITSGRARMIQA